MEYFIQKYYRPIILAVLLFTAFVSIRNADRDSVIYDEVAHIPAGYSYLKEHDIRLNPEHPPLLKDIAGFPLLFLDLQFDTRQPFWTENANDAQWDAGKYFLFGAGNDPDRIVFWSRLPFIFIYLILALFIFKWAREMGGTTAGLLSFLLFALDPNMLGHNHYVTTDLGIAAFTTFAFYFFIRFVKHPSWKNTFVFGAFWGLVQLVKFSSVLSWPIFGLVVILYPLVMLGHHDHPLDRREKLRALGEYIGKALVAFLFSLILIWIAYYGNAYRTPPDKLPEIMNHYFNKDATALEINTKQAINYLNRSDWSRPLADYFFGVARVFQRVAGGNVTYYFGQISSEGYFSYFPVVYLIKTPLPTLLFVMATIVLGLTRLVRTRGKTAGTPGHFVRVHIAEFTLLSFIILYSLTSILGRLNIGLRHLFPIFPFIYILTAVTVTRAIRKIHDRKAKSTFYLSAVFLVAFLAFETASSYPHYLSYFNQSVGGPKNGYHYVTDSNADWGQDLKRLAIFLRKHPEIERIRINYFGLADTRYYLGDKVVPWWDARRPVEEGWYAISTLFLQESLYDQKRSPSNNYSWLKNKKPVEQVGTSILIYHISAAEAASINQGN